jgi:DNA-binding protein WhiA
VAALRAELAAIDPARPCDRRAEMLGLLGAPAVRRSVLARLTRRLGREGTAGRSRGQAENAVTRAPGSDRSEAGMRVFDWSSSRSHCRVAWLRGVFLARGTLSLSGGRTHLEFVVSPDDAPTLTARLDELELPASWRLRRGHGVVTWKSGDTVVTFLRLIGGGAALLELEARGVSRALRGDLNRVVNAESANVQRAVLAAGRQLAAIAALEGDGRLQAQPYVVRMVAEARRETPEATFSELAERTGLHRSAVQRALERLERGDVRR